MTPHVGIEHYIANYANFKRRKRIEKLSKIFHDAGSGVVLPAGNSNEIKGNAQQENRETPQRILWRRRNKSNAKCDRQDNIYNWQNGITKSSIRSLNIGPFPSQNKDPHDRQHIKYHHN